MANQSLDLVYHSFRGRRNWIIKRGLKKEKPAVSDRRFPTVGRSV
jgi:hypothetical protein